MKTSIIALTLFAAFTTAELCAPCAQLQSAGATCSKTATSQGIPDSETQIKAEMAQAAFCICTPDNEALMTQ
jgi:hypothetical protein